MTCIAWATRPVFDNAEGPQEVAIKGKLSNIARAHAGGMQRLKHYETTRSRWNWVVGPGLTRKQFGKSSKNSPSTGIFG